MFNIRDETWNFHGQLLTAFLGDLSEEAVEELNERGTWKMQQEKNESVQAISIECISNLSKLPSNLGEIFPNSILLRIYDCGLKEISRNDLKGLKKLKDFHLFGTKIEELSVDLFADHKDIERITIARNRIKFIGKDLLNDLEKLKYVNMRNEAEFGLVYANNYQNLVIQNGTARLFKREQLIAILNGMFPSQAMEDVQELVKSDEFKDLTIKVGAEDFKVHKFLLIARSPTFAEMIKNNPDADELILEDIEVEVFKIILDYIYEDKMPLDFDEKTVKIFDAAAKLKLSHLTLRVGRILCKSINAANSLEMLQFAARQNFEELQEKSFDFIKRKHPDLQLSDELMNEPEKLMTVLEQNKIHEKKLKEAEEVLKKIKIEYEEFLKELR